MQGQSCFDFIEQCKEVSPRVLSTPEGYKGLYGFHKYWGKKPHEPLAFVIERLTQKGQIVVDPFVGSGTAAREAVVHGRRFIGFDINPVAIELSRLLIHPPSIELCRQAGRAIEKKVKAEILDSYRLSDAKGVATHYLWEEADLRRVWVAGHGRQQKRIEYDASEHDIALSQSFRDYRSQLVPTPRFFNNPRINAAPTLTLADLMTGRAQRNLDLILQAIDECRPEIRPALRLCLTAASGQMTKMVFAVTGRGKTNGRQSSKVEVGSWVIGYWRPKLHFEVNVWNCFEHRFKKLLTALKYGDALSSSTVSENTSDVISGDAQACLVCGDCRRLLPTLPEGSVHLVITDPPHNDRVPYLELSEFWNSLLGFTADLQNEIIISNAKERCKTHKNYTEAMQEFLQHAARIVHPDGFLVILFNTSKAREWQIFRPWFDATSPVRSLPFRYLGHFPCAYSATSVVQDNREGSLKTDHALVFDKMPNGCKRNAHLSSLESIPGWSTEPPANFRKE
jgi:hypothetical protein